MNKRIQLSPCSVDKLILMGIKSTWDYQTPDILDLFKLQKVKASDLESMLIAYDGKILRNGIKFRPIFHNGSTSRLAQCPDVAVWISYRSYKSHHIALIKITSYKFEESSNDNNESEG